MMKIRSVSLQEFFHFLLLPTKYNISPTIKTIIMTPVHTPALKMPAIASQLVMVSTKKNNTLSNDN
jgi:hypothetical protein